MVCLLSFFLAQGLVDEPVWHPRSVAAGSGAFFRSQPRRISCITRTRLDRHAVTLMIRSCGQHFSLSRMGWNRFCGTPWTRSSSQSLRCLFSTILCRRRWTQFWSSSVPWTCRLTSRLSQCPRSPLIVSRSVWWSGVSLKLWNSWWKCRPC